MAESKKRIFVTTDFSPCAAYAMGYAVELAQRLHADIVLGHVVDTSYLTYAALYGQEVVVDPNIPSVEAAAKKHLADEVGRIRARGVEAESAFARGTPVAELVRLIGESGAALVVTGAVATASGPHPGASEEVERLGFEIADTVYVHVRVAAVFGIGVLLAGWFLWGLRARYPGLLRLWALLLVVLVAQAILGEVQYRNALPWGLVLVHVFLAAAIWTLSLALAFAL